MVFLGNDHQSSVDRLSRDLHVKTKVMNALVVVVAFVGVGFKQQKRTPAGNVGAQVILITRYFFTLHSLPSLPTSLNKKTKLKQSRRDVLET